MQSVIQSVAHPLAPLVTPPTPAPAAPDQRVFDTACTVRFADCDPAGIVFFPQYLVMVNTLVEAWFDDGLRIPYAELLGARRTGLPTVRLEADFTAISRHGERLAQRLAVERLGRSSLTLRHEFSCDGALRMRVRQVLVCTSLATHRPQPLPSDVRAAMAPYAAVPAAEPRPAAKDSRC